MLEMIKYFLKYDWVSIIFVVVTLTVVALVVGMIIHHRRTAKLRYLSVYVDSIPFFAGLIGVIGFLTLIHSLSRALHSIHASGMGDPRVVAAGFQEFFFFITVTVGLFFVFLEAWLIVRMIYGSFLHELDTLPK